MGKKGDFRKPFVAAQFLHPNPYSIILQKIEEKEKQITK